ncbi:MAG: DNA mismatch repair protein mutS, partial [uncultured bacterium]
MKIISIFVLLCFCTQTIFAEKFCQTDKKYFLSPISGLKNTDKDETHTISAEKNKRIQEIKETILKKLIVYKKIMAIDNWLNKNALKLFFITGASFFGFNFLLFKLTSINFLMSFVLSESVYLILPFLIVIMIFTLFFEITKNNYKAELKSLINEFSTLDSKEALYLREELINLFEGKKKEILPFAEEAFPDIDNILSNRLTLENSESLFYQLDEDTINDLWIFGKNEFGEGLYYKLFHKWTKTFFGQERIKWLLKNSIINPDYIKTRQASIKELLTNLDLLKTIETAFKEINSLEKLKNSLNNQKYFESLSLKDKIIKLIISGLIITPLAAKSALLNSEFAIPVIITLVFGLNIMSLIRQQSKEQEVQTEWKRLFKLIQVLMKNESQIKSLHLKEIFTQIDLLLSGDLKKLYKKISSFNLNEAYQNKMHKLIELLGLFSELEAIFVQACTPLSYTEYDAWPEILDPKLHKPSINILKANHPYISIDTSTPNDVLLNDDRKFIIASGHQEAGKSTYVKIPPLLTILAQIGSPVCAESMALTPLKVRTHINRSDNIARGQSLYRVEVESLNTTTKLIANDPYYLIALEEILKGTKPEDRIHTLRAIIPHFVNSGALSLMATHDIEGIMNLEKEFPGVVNIHFKEEVIGETVIYSHLLHNGADLTSN